MSFNNPNTVILPWDWNLPLELVMWFIVFLLVAGIWIWTRAGVDRKNLPDIVGRNVEDFAGVSQEANGPIPLFLLLFYLTVGIAIVSYPTITLIFGYNY